MAKLTEKKRKWIIRQIHNGMEKKDIASAMKVCRMTVWRLEQSYKKHGKESFKIKKAGRHFEPLNPKCQDLIVKEWKKNKCGARKLHAVMKRKGFSVSRRKIEQVMVKKGFHKLTHNFSPKIVGKIQYANSLIFGALCRKRSR